MAYFIIDVNVSWQFFLVKANHHGDSIATMGKKINFSDISKKYVIRLTFMYDIFY